MGIVTWFFTDLYFFCDSYISVALFCIFFKLFIHQNFIFFILMNTVLNSIGKVFLFVWNFDYALKFRGMIWMSMYNGGMIYDDYLVHKYVFFLQIVCLLFNHIRDLNLVQIFLLMCIISNAYIFWFDLCTSPRIVVYRTCPFTLCRTVSGLLTRLGRNCWNILVTF